MMSNNPVLRGITKGMRIAATRKVERKSFTPVTAVELQSKAWTMVGDSLRKAMDRESSTPAHL